MCIKLIHTAIHSKQTHLLPFNAFLIRNTLNTQYPEAAAYLILNKVKFQ